MVFYKYHGCGNDFVLIDEVKNADYRSLAVRMCERRRGIGADGLIVCSPRPPSMRIFNSDGSEASMCGNGIRCAARYFADFGKRTYHGVGGSSPAMGTACQAEMAGFDPQPFAIFYQFRRAYAARDIKSFTGKCTGDTAFPDVRIDRSLSVNIFAT